MVRAQALCNTQSSVIAVRGNLPSCVSQFRIFKPSDMANERTIRSNVFNLVAAVHSLESVLQRQKTAASAHNSQYRRGDPLSSLRVNYRWIWKYSVAAHARVQHSGNEEAARHMADVVAELEALVRSANTTQLISGTAWDEGISREIDSLERVRKALVQTRQTSIFAS